MPQDRQDLARRVGLTKDTDTIKGSPFRAAMAELARVVGAEHPKIAELKTRFGKSAWQEFSSFPVRDYLNLVYDGADLLEPKAGSAPAAMTQLGYAVSHAFLSSAIGKVATTMVSGKAPLDLFSYAPGVYAVSASYGQRTFSRLSDHQAVLKIRGDFLPPDYHLGVIRCGMEFFGHQVELEAKVYSLLDADYVLTPRKAA